MTGVATTICVGLAQMAPVWLDRAATLDKVQQSLVDAGERGVQLLAFGEALVPGYPFWPELTGGAEFDSPRQKELFALYLNRPWTWPGVGWTTCAGRRLSWGWRCTWA